MPPDYALWMTAAGSLAAGVGLYRLGRASGRVDLTGELAAARRLWVQAVDDADEAEADAANLRDRLREEGNRREQLVDDAAVLRGDLAAVTRANRLQSHEIDALRKRLVDANAEYTRLRASIDHEHVAAKKACDERAAEVAALLDANALLIAAGQSKDKEVDDLKSVLATWREEYRKSTIRRNAMHHRLSHVAGLIDNLFSWVMHDTTNHPRPCPLVSAKDLLPPGGDCPWDDDEEAAHA